MAEPRSNNSSSPRRTKSEFPIKVYAMLELADNFFDFAQAVTWLPHGRAFRIHNTDKFMEEVVPVFFNQTKIRSFKRQLHLWGFHRIGRGNDQVWYHNNFLRGKPEDMKHMVRTKIKGCKDTNVSSVVPNFDDMPPLPVCNERPPAILDAMKKAIMQLPNASGAIAARCCFAMPAATASVSPQPYLENFIVTPQPHVGNVPYDTDYHMMAMPRPRSEPSFQFNVEYNHSDTFETPLPPAFHRRVSTDSPLMTQPCMPTMNYHLPLQEDFGTIASSSQPKYETSVQRPPHFESEQSHDMFHDLSGFCFSSSVQHKPSDEDFEPLPFMDDNTPCDDFASFIEGAIQQIEG